MHQTIDTAKLRIAASIGPQAVLIARNPTRETHFQRQGILREPHRVQVMQQGGGFEAPVIGHDQRDRCAHAERQRSWHLARNRRRLHGQYGQHVYRARNHSHRREARPYLGYEPAHSLQGAESDERSQ